MRRIAPALAPLLALSLALGAAPARAQLGELRVAAGDAETREFLADVEVAIPALRVRARTDSSGEARLGGIPAGVHVLEARRVGYAPLRAPVHVSGRARLDVAILLHRIAQPLPEVSVTGRAVSPWLSEFEANRKRGLGKFITEEEIRRSLGSDLPSLMLARVPGIAFRTDADGVAYEMHSLRGQSSISDTWCKVAVYLDGVRVANDNPGIVPLALLGGIEYHTLATAPVRYREASSPRGGTAACGVLLLWTRP